MSSPEAACAPGHTDEIGDLLRTLCRVAGFTVRTWAATENGDDRDSFYWCHLKAPTIQSVGTFETPAEAWLDCCSASGALESYHASIAEAGCSISRQGGFLTWYWHGAAGETGGPYAHSAEAMAACILAYDLRPSAPDQADSVSCVSSAQSAAA